MYIVMTKFRVLVVIKVSLISFIDRYLKYSLIVKIILKGRHKETKILMTPANTY